MRRVIGAFRVPPFLLPIYQAAGIDYGVPWQVLAAINEIETDYGRNLSTSPAGAAGWMQFLPSTWAQYGLDANGDGTADAYNPVDAIFSAARYLHAAGAAHDLRKAVFAYNHADWYVTSVLLRARLLQLIPDNIVHGLTGLMQARFPVAGHLGPYAARSPTPVRLHGSPAVLLRAPERAPVIAVADGRVVSIGENRVHGRNLTLEDSYGNRYTYSRLGSISQMYPVLRPHRESRAQIARELGAPAAHRTAVAQRARRTSRASRERLPAHPSDPRARGVGGRLGTGGSGASDYFSEPIRLSPGQYALAPLRPGARVVAGMILGRAGAGSSGVIFQIRPAGAKAPLDPRPIIAGWKLFGKLTSPAGSQAARARRFGSGDPSLGQLLLASKDELQRRVLSDPRVVIYRCGRRDIEAGIVDRRVLAVIEYLSYSGLAPGVSGLVCGRAGQSGARTQAGSRVVISTLDGTPVAGHQQDGSIVTLAIRRLLQLQGALRPARIVSLHSYPGQPLTLALPDHAAQLEVDFSAAPGSRRAHAGGLGTAQWTRLIGRLAHLLPGKVKGGAVHTIAAPATAPSVAVDVPPSPLRFGVIVNATAAATGSRTIASVVFQTSPAGADTWTTFATATAPPYAATFDTFSVANGPYDLRAVATDSAGESQDSPIAADRVVANGATFVALADPGSRLRGTVQLLATPEDGGFTPEVVNFQRSPAGAADWTTFATAAGLDVDGNPQPFTAALDTTAIPDGAFDLRVTATDSFNNLFVGELHSNVLVDNTPPTSTLAVPGGSLGGVVTLTASAQDAGAGVAAVAFERSPPGSGTWTTIGVDTRAPFSRSFDTRLLRNGSYDLRVVVTDGAGNTAPSPVLSGVAVSNPASVSFGNLTITNYVAPATNISLLGEIAGSAQHETWAYGYTSAPPATVNGSPLPYTAPGGNQLVLLRYTDDEGWQIADVLRNADGSPFRQVQGATLSVTGQMTPRGEAWIALTQQAVAQPIQIGVFHRNPGGRFGLDPAATNALTVLMSSASGANHADLRLGQSPDGSTYGLLSAPKQPARQTSISDAAGRAVVVNTSLDYGLLDGGAWTVGTASLPPDYVPKFNDNVVLRAADPTGPGTGWGALSASSGPAPLMLGQFDRSGWHFVSSRLDALDLTDAFASGRLTVGATNVRADSGGVWVGASVDPSARNGASNLAVARYDGPSAAVISSWCGAGIPRESLGCGEPLDPNHPAAVPDAVFDTSQGEVALALASGFVDVYAHGDWTSVPAPGFLAGAGRALFVAPDDGWLVGSNALARVTARAIPSPLAPWPQANRSPLMSVALPPGHSGTGTAGALAVGLNGTALHYDLSAGWEVDATPPRVHHLGLLGVAFTGGPSAIAVGQLGTILRWDGTSWTEDPQSVSVTQAQLNSVAFGDDGQGWAVGRFGTILHYDGTVWSEEQVDAEDASLNITSVTVAGGDVFAVAGGNLIMRGADGVWQRIAPSSLPTPAPPPGSLRLVSGLPDGGVVAAGQSVVLVRQSSSASFEYSAQPLEGIAVGLAAFRDADGVVRAFASLAPPILDILAVKRDVGFPAGDGELMRQTATGWQDLSRAQEPISAYSAAGDGALKPDPVLAVATAPDGSSAWAVGGYAGTHTAAGLGTDAILPARPAGWDTSAIWRYDAGGSVASAAVAPAHVSLPAHADTVSFAFFSSALCKIQCAATRDAQPDVNLRAAATQIAAFGAQPGGPAFAILGGNARGPIAEADYQAGKGAVDVAHLPDLLSPLGSLPLYAAYGPRDGVPTSADPATPWADALAQAPAPFGRGPAAAGITPRGSGEPTGGVNRYYSFDATQHGGRLRVIVLDNSAGSLEATAPGQTAWLDSQLGQATSADLPVVVVSARPLSSAVVGAADDGAALSAQLAAAGVLAVFTTAGSNYTSQVDRRTLVPDDAAPGDAQIPEYEGATLGYQQPQNNGVLWYSVSVDTANRKLSVQAIPVVDSLALKPLSGLKVARSSTLSFDAIGRRPVGSIATPPNDDGFPGYDSYVNIPSTSCKGCIGPSYSFKSADPSIGDFVTPSGPGSIYPKLASSGRPIPSASSGLFCGFNSGRTTVKVTSGLLTASLPVTVGPGAIGRPCGTVFRQGVGRTIVVPGPKVTKPQTGGPGPQTPPASPPAKTVVVQPSLPRLALPPPPHVRTPPAPRPPPPVVPPPPQPAPAVGVPPVVPPLIPPGVTPVPPGGASASAQATARREEKARKHASQSAYVIRPAGTPAEDWFYPAVGVVGVLAVLLIAGGLRPGPRPKLAFVESREWDAARRRRSRS